MTCGNTCKANDQKRGNEMSWTISVTVKNGDATVIKSDGVKDGWYTISGHESEYSESVTVGVQVRKGE